MNEPTPATQVCRYCGRPFVELAHHARERLLPYCSHGCRLAVQGGADVGRAHVCHCSVEAMPAGGLERAMATGGDGFTGGVGRMNYYAGGEESGAEVRRFDLLVWLAEIPTATRNVVILRARGGSWRMIALAAGGITAVCARERFFRALRRWPELREYFRLRGQRG